MANELYDAVKQVQIVVRAITGIKGAPQDPPEAAAVYPFAVSFLSDSSIDMRPQGCYTHEATIVLELHCSRVNLPIDIQTVMPYVDSIPAAIIADSTLGAHVDTVRWPMRVRLQQMTYGETKTLGLRFEIPVKKVVVI